MKMTLGKKITVLFFIPLLIIISVLSMLIFSTISQYVNNWVQLEIRGITEINATDLAGQIDSVRIAVLSIANILESVDGNSENARERVSNVLHSMLINDAIYNVWVVYEPQAFDGNDDAHRYDYPGAPSGRFIRSYVKQDGEIVVAPDMDDVSIDDPELSPWYTRPRDSGQLYIDLDNENVNIWNYGLDEDPIYTLSIVSPIFRDGQVIGAIGADIEFDSMVISIDGGLRSTVAVFYSNGRIFYSPDLKYAEESIYTLGFSDPALIRGSFDSAEPLFLPDEYCIFTDTMGVTFFQPVPIRNYDQGGLFLYVSTPRTVIFERLFPVFLIIAATAITLIGVMVVMLIYVMRKISNPINQLTLAADAISQGNIETEIGYYSDANSEIGLLSQSLHRMVERFRVHAMDMEQAQRETFAKRQIETFITDSSSMRETFERLTVSLCEHADVFKTTIVYINTGKASAFSYVNPQLSAYIPERNPNAYDFLHNGQVEALLADRKIIFLNSHSIAAGNMTFLDEQAKSACLIPLREDVLLGYLILENSTKITLSEGTESILMYIAGILSVWLSGKDWDQNQPQ